MHDKKKRQKLNYYAKIMIAVAITLLLYGFYLDLKNDVRLIDPVTGVTSLNDDHTHSTVDINSSGEELEEIPEPEDKPDKTKEDTNKDNNSNNTTKSDDSSNDSNHSSEDSVSNYNDTSQSSQSDTHVLTIEETNNNLRREIENSFNITIRYGGETEGYVVGGLSTISITNPTTINSTLTKLKNCLSVYPTGFFQEIRSGGIPLTIYLIERYSTNGVTGVTDSNAYFANISIAIAYPFEESFYHETYHYIERYMFDRKGMNYNTWNSFNPDGFAYGSIDPSFSYASNGGREDSFFVNNYAQTSEAEDRASTFEYMMDDAKASCLNKNQNVWRKATTMSNMIDAAFNTCSPYTTEYWERFL